ncbi:hypothetical protein DQ04_02361010 [Trypanosoma grayi]|uniref:hypothetical protein n=1 Tax=Trypanosoma grayi TaxID=71804 RepID=UPI0004F4AFCF|nr:hypothetical protein DQ04_02361010 [Trypanosoma grayi]KEG11689.1 hypothetical protein DQ04_02361010 [Trypanosoma grayi]
MPPKHWARRRTAAAAASGTPHHASSQAEDFTQQLMEAMSVANACAGPVLQPSESSEEHEADATLECPAVPAVANVDDDDDSKDTVANVLRLQMKHDSRFPAERKRCRGETSPDRRHEVTAVRQPTTCSATVKRVTVMTPAETAHRSSVGDATLKGAGKNDAVATDAQKRQESLSLTEAEVLQQHGHLSQLNNLYLPSTRSRSSDRSTVDDEEEVATGKEACGEEERLRCRREELAQIPAGSLALYTRLAECGVNAMERPFATCVVKRAQDAIAAWAAGFS